MKYQSIYAKHCKSISENQKPQKNGRPGLSQTTQERRSGHCVRNGEALYSSHSDVRWIILDRIHVSSSRKQNQERTSRFQEKQILHKSDLHPEVDTRTIK